MVPQKEWKNGACTFTFPTSPVTDDETVFIEATNVPIDVLVRLDVLAREILPVNDRHFAQGASVSGERHSWWFWIGGMNDPAKWTPEQDTKLLWRVSRLIADIGALLKKRAA